MAFAVLLGVAGGIYIYKPYFEPPSKSSGQQNQDVPKKENEIDWSRSQKNYIRCCWTLNSWRQSQDKSG